MLYIILAILTAVSLLIFFKLFEAYKVNTFYAIMVNYLTAAITGIVVNDTSFSFSSIVTASWLKIALPLGLLFILIFYLISQTAQKISMATASVANKMSVAMPVLFSMLFLHQQVVAIKWLGIILALVSVYLTTKPSTNGDSKLTRNYLWLPITVFIGSGLIDIAINAANAFYITSPNDSSLFSTSTFLSAFSFGLLIIGLGFIKPSFAISTPPSSTHEWTKVLIGGFLLGIPNYFSIFFIFKSLDTKLMSSAELFPLLNVSNVVLSAILGFLLYKERLSIINICGILAAILAIVCIAF